ncbi:MAG: glycosyltransferase family 39 protein [Thermoguttaceae bacterium]|jgi:hypothetical protein|nr:glycosyltransferase family 39 protein [Thermoguttaceae bacterium]
MQLRPLPLPRTFWLLLIVAALVRVGVLAAMPDALRADPDGYRQLAENVLEHGVLGHGPVPTAYRPPAYPLLLVPCVALGAGTRVAIGMLHVLLGLATVGLTFALARRAGMKDIPAALAAGFVALDPILLAQSALVMSETLAALLVVLGVWLLDRCTHRPTVGNAALAGAAWGGVVLCRPGLLPFAALTAILLPWLAATARNAEMQRGSKEEKGKRGSEEEQRRWRSAAQVFAGIVAGLAIVVGPWVVRNQVAFARPIAATTHGGYTLLLGNNPFFYEHLRSGRWFQAWDAEPFHDWWRRQRLAAGLSTSATGDSDSGVMHDAAPQPLSSPAVELQTDALAYRHAFAVIRRQPGTFAWSCLVRAGHFWSPLPYRLSPDESSLRRAARYGVAAWYAAVFTLAAIGLGPVLFRENGIRRSVFAWSLLAALALTAVHTFYWSNLRMRAPLIPLVAIAAAEGATSLQRRRMRT